MESGQAYEVVKQLMGKYGLAEQDCSTEISDGDLDTISHSCCAGGAWKSLAAPLEIDRAIVEDINSRQMDDKEKRSTFFYQWRQINGSEATYMKLASALLKIQHKLDAEKVLKLLQTQTGSFQYGSDPSLQETPPLASTPPSTVSPPTSSTMFPSAPLPPKVHMQHAQSSRHYSATYMW